MAHDGQPPDLKSTFYHYFHTQVSHLESQIASISTTTSVDRAAVIDQCLAGISRLNSEVIDAVAYVPAHDVATYAKIVKKLGEELEVARRKESGGGGKGGKFGFKFRSSRGGGAVSKGQESSEASGKGVVTEVKDVRKAPPGIEKNEETRAVGARDGAVPTVQRSGQYITLPADTTSTTTTARSSSATISDVTRSVVNLCKPPSSATNTDPGGLATLTLKNVTNSLIISGLVSGSIHITNVHSSVLVTACRQFRMHASDRVDVYLHCASRPIIEDCSDIRFAPLQDSFTPSQAAASSNQWDQIDDFTWLKMEASPNFSILPESNRISEEVFRETIRQSEHMEVDGILENCSLL